MLESNSFFLRVAVFDLRNRSKDVKLKFRLLPMIHIGEPGYYERILDLANECDELLFEGVGSDEMNDSETEITSMYSPLAEKLDLEIQTNCIKTSYIKTTLIHADYDETGEEEARHKLGFLERIHFLYIIPFLLFIGKFFMTRELLAKVLKLNPQDISFNFGNLVLKKEQTESDWEEGSLNHYLTEGRDNLVLQTLYDKYHEYKDEPKLIGIMYGAAHMKSYSRFLMDSLNFATQKGTFVKVFDISPIVP